MTVKGRLIRGLFAGGFGQVVTVAIQLVSLPMFLHAWGPAEYGEWLVLSAIPAYLAMSDLGFANVAANEMTMEVAEGEQASAVCSFQSTIFVLLFASTLVLIAMPILIAIQYTSYRLPLHSISAPDVTRIIGLLSGLVIVGFFGGLASAGFRCDGNFARGSFYSHLLRLAEFGATIAVLVAHGGPVGVVTSMLIVRASGIGILFLVLKRLSPWIILGFENARWARIRELMRPAFAFMAFPVGFALSQQGLVLVIGSEIGPIAVVVWSAMRTVSRVLVQAMGIINAAVWPELSAAYGANDVSLARKLHRAAVQTSLWLTIPPTILIYLFGDAIFKVWGGRHIALDSTVFALLLLEVVANLLWGTSSVVAVAINRHSKIAVAFLISTSLTMLLALVLTKWYGLTGTAISLLATDIIMIPLVVRSSLSFVADTFAAFGAAVARPPSFLSRVFQRLE